MHDYRKGLLCDAAAAYGTKGVAWWHSLSGREQDILFHRQRGMSYVKIGKLLSLTGPRVNQIHKRVLAEKVEWFRRYDPDTPGHFYQNERWGKPHENWRRT